MSCGKKPYETKSIAKKFLKKYNKMPNRDGPLLTQSYYCYECSSWHNTSLSKHDSRHLQKNRFQKKCDSQELKELRDHFNKKK